MEKRKWTEGIVATPTLQTQSLEVNRTRVTMKQDEETETHFDIRVVRPKAICKISLNSMEWQEGC